MRIGTLPEQGGIVLIPVPFTDLSTNKRVISNNAYHRASAAMVVVAMTSNPTPVPYSLTIRSADLERGALNRPGTVRVDRVYTLSQGLAVRIFGKVNTQTLDHIRQTLGRLVAA
jgi:mRNA interferase MazF